MTEEEKAAFEAAQKRAADAEHAMAAAKVEAEAAKVELAAANERAPLAEIGEKALEDLETEILRLESLLRLPAKEHDPLVIKMIDTLVAAKDYASLREIERARHKAVDERYPAGLQGDPDPGDPEGEAGRRRLRPQDSELV